MQRINELKPVYSEILPRHEDLEEGKIYLSYKYSVSKHLCACGCKGLTVLPFSTTHMDQINWIMTGDKDKVTFRPSIGNWQFSCMSHYYITDNKIKWL